LSICMGGLSIGADQNSIVPLAGEKFTSCQAVFSAASVTEKRNKMQLFAWSDANKMSGVII
jgi:hypothetical protein